MVYMQTSESVQKMHKILTSFGIQINHSIQKRRPYLVLINNHKRIFHRVDFAVPVVYKVKVKEGENLDK